MPMERAQLIHEPFQCFGKSVNTMLLQVTAYHVSHMKIQSDTLLELLDIVHAQPNPAKNNFQ